LNIGAASPGSFTDPVLFERYQGLLGWRDEIVVTFRRRA
jgi:hypothetical protein